MHYSGFWRRLAAGLIDHILVYGVVIGVCSLGKSPITAICRNPQGWQSCLYDREGSMVISNINISFTIPWILLICTWLYFSFFESSKYQATPGMMLFSMRITDYEKKKISFWRATGRFFASYLSSLFLCIGYIMIAFTPRKQGLHDYIAKTLVVTVK